MSVIAGEVDFGGESRGRAAILLAALGFVAAEREAVWEQGECALVAKRLIVEPRDRTALLLVPTATGIGVAIEGHLYNRPELAEALGLPRESEDEALIAAAWEKWGDEFAARLNGEFALAAWDSRAHRLLLATDHAGTVPLYYRVEDSRRVIFGTELDPILAASNATPQPDWAKIADFLAMSWWEVERTYVAGISAAAPGSAVVFSAGQVRKLRYWDFAGLEGSPIRDVDEGVAAFRDVLERAVTRRMPEGSPVAAHLTGGLDSSSIAAIVARQHRATGGALHLFSVVPWRPGEGENAGDVAFIPAFLRDYPEVKHAYVLGRAEAKYPLPGIMNGPANLEITAAVEEITARAKSAGCRVLLSGSGGEAGPSYYGSGVHWMAWRQGYWRWVAREMMAAAPTWWERARWCRRRLIGGRFPPANELLAERWRAACLELRPEFLAEHRMRDRCLGGKRVRSDPVLAGQLQQLTALQHHGRLHNWAHQGRAEGIRYRYPCLDREVLEMVRRLPAPVHVHRGQTRGLLRRAMEMSLPPEIARRESGPSRLVAAGPVEAFAGGPWQARMRAAWPVIKPVMARSEIDFVRAGQGGELPSLPIASRVLRSNIVAVGEFLSRRGIHDEHTSVRSSFG
ncbi:MAG TPA: asparagine synthase-related protein [Opitutus sp.]|nr:asparagine synthase-related protein [Opitutus sp.]